MKKILILAMAVTLISVLLFGACALGYSASEDSKYRMTEIVTGSKMFPVEQPPFNVSTLSMRYLPFNILKETVPENILQEIKHAAEKITPEESFAHIILTTKNKAKTYHALIAVYSNKDLANIRYFEVIVGDNTTEIVRIQPVIVETSFNETTVATYEANDENSLAEVVVGRAIKGYQLTLQTGDVVGWYYAEWYIEGRNVFGWTLWKLTSSGYFYLYNQYVLDIIDTSEAWAQGLLGWSVSNFYSSLSFHPYLLWGQVNANAGFNGPFQQVHAWSWIRMYGDATYTGNAGIY